MKKKTKIKSNPLQSKPKATKPRRENTKSNTWITRIKPMQAAPNQQPIRKSKRESKKEKKNDTLKKELLNSLIGIHGTLLKHCINLILSGIHCDLLDVIDHLLYVDWDWNPAGPTNAHLCKPRNLINTQNKITTKPHQHQYHHRPQSVNLSSSSSSSSFKRLEKSLFVLFVQLHTTTEIMQEMKQNQKKKKKNLNFFPFFSGVFLNLIYVNVRRKKKKRQERDRERGRWEAQHKQWSGFGV